MLNVILRVTNICCLNNYLVLDVLDQLCHWQTKRLCTRVAGSPCIRPQRDGNYVVSGMVYRPPGILWPTWRIPILYRPPNLQWHKLLTMSQHLITEVNMSWSNLSRLSIWWGGGILSIWRKPTSLALRFPILWSMLRNLILRMVTPCGLNPLLKRRTTLKFIFLYWMMILRHQLDIRRLNAIWFLM